MEIWKEIIDSKGKYKLSNFGKVWSCKSNRLLGQFKNRKGYLMCQVTINKKPKTFAVHRWVAIYFIENPKNLPQVNHLDGIKTNNNDSNLEWITDRDNKLHAYRNKLHNVNGERNPFSKLTNNQVLEIREFYKNDPPGRLKNGRLSIMAKKLNVTEALISLIRNNKGWTHI